MNARYLRSRSLLAFIAGATVLSTAVAQTAPAANDEKKDEAVKLEKFVVTGSSIKRPADEGALPISVFTQLDLQQEGIASAEQLIMNLNVNGNGFDNLASNADVIGSGGPRGNNGATSANLRGQGSNATLILLNGRRVASHGLNGGVVDLNSIPFAAIERVEVLKDGASATYGTDAVGGVINFITKRDFRGLVANASSDITQDGGGNIFRYSLVGGWGNLNKDGWNVMASLALSDSKMLRGDQRDFVNTFQPQRALSPDTRGAPIATITTISSLYSVLSRDNGSRTTGPFDPAKPTVRVDNINILDLPTNTAGYANAPGMGPYESFLWLSAANGARDRYGAAWDTGRAAVLQQPVKNTNFVGRGSYKLGEHVLILEAVIGRSDSTKSFSPIQVSSSSSTTNPFYNLAYPSSGADYTRVFNALVAYFPALEVNRGLPMPIRWRAMPLGNREIRTISDTRRFFFGSEGPLRILPDWEYRTGVSQSESKSKSRLNHGYVYGYPFAALIKDGTVNPFSYTQTDAAMAALDKVRADGVELYGGKFKTTTIDFTASGPVWHLPAGQIYGAVGADFRREEYSFGGANNDYVTTTSPTYVPIAPFDNALATATTLSRDVKAVFAELQIPLWKGLDLNLAGRRDQYTGFGSTTNPKVTLRFAPIEKIMFRASYSTGFRVPTFKQQFDPAFESIIANTDLIDPVSGDSIPANSANSINGGKLDLKPEEAEMTSFGVVVSPIKNITFTVDWWSITRTGTIETLSARDILANYTLFPDRIIRDVTTKAITKIDVRPINSGETSTKGVEYSARGDFDVFGGKLIADINVSQLLEKKRRVVETVGWSASEVGRWTRYGDLGLKWKYTAAVSYRKGKWTGRVSQLFRSGYMDYVPPGIANGLFVSQATAYNPKVDEYVTYNASLTYRWSKDVTIIAGIKNLLNQDPPFALAHDTGTGAGSSWEPRIADPRGRAFTLSVEYKFF